ncbi:MAG: OmpA family protein [Smithella sp.]
MPDPSGKVGVLEVITANGRQTLNKAWQTTESGGINKAPREPKILDREEVRKIFREALAAEPVAPVNFIIYFKTNSANPLTESLTLLPKVMNAIHFRNSIDIIISGHTDTVGSSDYNRDLSLRRAKTVANILTARGVDRQIIQLTYHGKGNPLIPTLDGVPEPRNRRVEITVR